MRGNYHIVSLAVLGVGLAGWVALGWAQSRQYKLPVGGRAVAQQAPVTRPAALPAVEAAPVPARRETVLPAATVPISAAPTAPGLGVPLPAPGEKKPEGAAPAADPGNPTGLQEPAVSMEWIGPATIQLGQTADYTLAVRSACKIALQQVVVRVRIPNGMTVTATEPEAQTEDNILKWELATLSPRQSKNFQIRMVAAHKGDIACQASITFTGSSALTVLVREPKLDLSVARPEKLLVGDTANFVLTISNPGDGPAEQVKIHTSLSEGLEHARGNQVDFEVGNLAAGESRSIQVACTTKTGGEQKCEAIAEALGGLMARNSATVNVTMPRLELEATGPKLRYLHRKALYTFKITNPGDATATNVNIHHVIPAGFKFVVASDGGRHDFATRTVSWFLGEIAPGQIREVRLEVTAINLGEHRLKTTAQAARGLKAENELQTRVEGLSAILLEVVDTEDPVEVGADTTYELRVTNTGSKTETDIKLVCTLPDQMQFKGAQGPSHYHEEGKEIVFDPLPKLAPRADAIYRVIIKATAPGDVRFKTRITSTNLVEPVHEEESTRIYED